MVKYSLGYWNDSLSHFTKSYDIRQEAQVVDANDPERDLEQNADVAATSYVVQKIKLPSSSKKTVASQYHRSCQHRLIRSEVLGSRHVWLVCMTVNRRPSEPYFLITSFTNWSEPETLISKSLLTIFIPPNLKRIFLSQIGLRVS